MKYISSTAAKKALEEMFLTGDSADTVIDRLDLWLLPTEEVVLLTYCTVCDNPELALKYRDGNVKILNTIVGKVMGQTRGRAIGAMVEELAKASIDYIYQHFP